MFYILSNLLIDLGKRKSNEILDWLSQSNHEAKYADSLNRDRYKEGTGRWFLDSPQFKLLCRKPGQTLFCPGIPGAGKTIMASLAIRNLFRTHSESIVSFLYCEYARKDEQTTDGLLTALLRQFSRENCPLPDPVSSLHRVFMETKENPTRDQLIEALIAVAKTYDQTFVIIDALDECSEQTSREILSSMRRLQKESAINLLVTSRPVPQIEGLFRGDLWLPIQAHESDVEIYLQSRLQGLPDWVREDETLQRRIQKSISKAINGMLVHKPEVLVKIADVNCCRFLLARLHFDSLKGKQTQGEIEEALDAFQDPQRMTDPLKIAYDGAIQRIADQTPGEIKWAQKVLSWVILARRPLSPMELKHALGLRPGDRELNSKNFPHPSTIVSLCAGLALINQESNVVQLVHYTTKEYFEHNPPKWIQSAKADLARCCLQYLALDVFADGECSSYEALEERTSKNAFFCYAACYWGQHSQGVEADVKDVARTFLSNYNCIKSADQATMIQATPTYSFPTCLARPTIHTLAFFSLAELFPFLVNAGLDQQQWLRMVNSRDSYARTPLSLAAENGNEALAKMLVDSGATVDPPAGDHYSPLYVAAENGHEKVMKILIGAEDKADVNWKDRYDVPLIAAAAKGHEAVVKILIDAEDRENADSKDRYIEPLKAAAWNGQEAVLKMLIDAEDRLNADSKDGYTDQLCVAAWSGYEVVVKRLINLGDRVDVDAKNYSGYTPLSLAAMKGHEVIARMLIDLGDRVDVNSKDNRGRTPLYWAIENGHEAVAKILRDKGGC